LSAKQFRQGLAVSRTLKNDKPKSTSTYSNIKTSFKNK